MSIDILDDARPGPVAFDVRARRADGGRTTATFTLEAICGASPLNPDPALTTAGPLWSGLDVAWSGLGAMPVGNDDRAPALFDGIVAPSTGYRGDIGGSVTVDLAGDNPAPVIGVLLNPYGQTLSPDTLRDFVVETSLDGATFTPVFTGTLLPLALEQPFLFAEPVEARFARLVLLNSYNPDYPNGVGLGEFKVIAAPATAIAAGQPFNLADPVIGGHVVATNPLLNDPQLILTADQRTQWAYIEDEQAPITWVVGFHHDRAAQIAELQWQNGPSGDPAQRFTTVDIAVSADTPLGPWTPLGTWTLDPASSDVQTYALDATPWARFVRFTAPPLGERGAREFPDALRIFERAQSPDYRTILGEYGEYRQASLYESAQGTIAGAEQPLGEAADNNTQATAQALDSGQVVRGTVQTNVDEDWYRIVVPEGENTVAITVTGEPALTVDVQLVDASGVPVEVKSQTEGNRTQVTALAKPGTYYLQVSEPRRSVVFSWDTSGSVGPYTNAIYQSLASFTRGIDPQLEVVNLLPFSESPRFLLPDWSGDPLAAQAALTSYPRGDSSSNAEFNLLTASEALGQRQGTRAVVLITDAESNGYDKTPALWAEPGYSAPARLQL